MRKSVNEHFFSTWSHNMAYVLGFFAADGSMYTTKRGGKYIEFQITDGKLLKDIRRALGSEQKLSIFNRASNHKTVYRLQIGSKIMYDDLLALGLTQNKSKTLGLPPVPDEYFSDFLRGYFDGDGCVCFGYFKFNERRGLRKTFLIKFTSGSKNILEGIKENLERLLQITGAINLYGGAWRLQYSAVASRRLYEFFYTKKNLEADLIYLDRKYKIYAVAIASYAGVA